MTTHYDEELIGFKNQLLAMGAEAERLLGQAIQAVTARDNALAESVQQDDDIMDRFEMEVDNAAINLFAKAPLASDLRLVMVAMKISQNLERIGDEATTIARRAIELNAEPPLQLPIDFPRTVALATPMLRDALDAFHRLDPTQARAVVPRDKEVDALNRRLHRELAEYMASHPEAVSRCLCSMIISKALERVADHATNIAEEVVYLCEAFDIRHEANRTIE